jgi:uncharacterized protein (DUF1697 family)
MTRYTAFLRGINVGGHVTVPMADLKKAFEEMGFEKVKTLLNSGNVVFEADADAADLGKQIEERLARAFNRRIGVLLRGVDELKDLADRKPFKGIEVTKQTRLYVTFLPERPRGSPALKVESPGPGFDVLRVSHREICSVLTLDEGGDTVKLMASLEKQAGKDITTRNWNTIERVLKA